VIISIELSVVSIFYFLEKKKCLIKMIILNAEIIVKTIYLAYLKWARKVMNVKSSVKNKKKYLV